MTPMLINNNRVIRKVNMVILNKVDNQVMTRINILMGNKADSKVIRNKVKIRTPTGSSKAMTRMRMGNNNKPTGNNRDKPDRASTLMPMAEAQGAATVTRFCINRHFRLPLCMVSMSANVELQSQMKGGMMGALKRMVGGESAFVSTFTARGGPGEVAFAPGAPGDIAALELNNQAFYVQSSSYMAGDASLTVDTKWGGAKSFFGGEGLFVLQVYGTGLLLVSSYGAIHRKRLAPGERYVVDTGHLVAWEGTTQYQLRKATQGIFRSFVSGEGIVAEFMGPGEILIQTRNLAALAGILKPFFPSQGSGGGGGFNIGFGS
jgi:uncharacterized protein (TIGR00266 family)